jgi:dipeptidyl aminopeptidase/acylaminoacyl peptidase
VNTETYLRHTLEEWSEDARVPPGLADRALRRRTGRRVAKVALAVGAAALLAGTGAVAVGTRSGPAPVARPMDTSLHTDPDHAPPQRLVAAGQVAVSAYYIGHGDPRKFTRTWYLYNPTSGGYAKVPWAWVAVAPGLRQAAVLDGPLPTARVGILDMKTQRVTRWISLRAAAGGLSWSPDGRRLLVTTYARDPDAMGASPFSGARTGFIVMNVKSGEAHFHSLLFDRENPNTRQDFGWSRSGKLIWAQRMNAPARVFYDLNGAPRPAPPHEADQAQQAGISPNGRLIALSGPPPGPNTVVNDLRTGQQAGVQPMQQLRAWADDTHLIAQGCLPNACGGKLEFYNRLVLVDVSGKTITPLTGYKKGGWEPIFTHR